MTPLPTPDARRTTGVGRPLLASLFTLLASCSDINSPDRSDFYEWRLRVAAIAPSTGVDTLGFTWPRDRGTVTFWAQDTLDLPARVDRAIATWQGQFLYGEFRGTRVGDSAIADVLVFGRGAPQAPFLQARAAECEGVTDVRIDQVTRLLTLPIRVYVLPRFDVADPGVSACLDLTTTHEVGHGIGLFEHSDDPSDLMYFNPTVAGPSDRDRNTAQRAYHTPSTVRLSATR
jgi:hypothetical protein